MKLINETIISKPHTKSNEYADDSFTTDEKTIHTDEK